MSVSDELALQVVPSGGTDGLGQRHGERVSRVGMGPPKAHGESLHLGKNLK